MIDDTLKEKQPDGTLKWSRTSLTMASAWFCVFAGFWIDLGVNGFNHITFTEMLSVALGIRWVASKSKTTAPS